MSLGRKDRFIVKALFSFFLSYYFSHIAEYSDVCRAKEIKIVGSNSNWSIFTILSSYNIESGSF